MGNYQTMADKLFEAMDIITSKRISALEFDKTLICTIENVEKAKNGAYKVTDGVSSFIAYGDKDKQYTKGTKVYVKVPNGDMNNQKIITGLYLSDNNEYVTYISPLDSFIDITGNMIEDEINLSLKANDYNRPSIVVWEYTPKRIFSEKARDKRRKYVTTDDTLSLADKTRRLQVINTLDSYEDTLEKILNANISKDDKIVLTNELNLITIVSGIKNYNRVGISGDFKTSMDSRVVNGSYGLRLDIMAKSESGTTEMFCYFLDAKEDMYGNPYAYSTYYKQEQVYDISNIFEIINLRLVLYQKSDFVLEDGTDLIIDKIEDEDDIFLKNPYLSFGYALDNFKEDTVILGTNDDLTYSTEIKPPERNIYMRWIHLLNGKFYSIDEMNETPKQAAIHWYRYKIEQNRADELAGIFWKEFIPENDKYNYTFEPDYTTNEDGFKVIIEMPSRQAITEELNKNEELKTLMVDLENESILYEMLDLTDLEKLNVKYLEIKTNYIKEEDLEKYNEFYNIILEARSKTKFYYSEPIIFTNEISQTDEAIDLLQGLSIKINDDNYRGIYRLYNETNMIINQNEANKLRTLKAEYSSVITGMNILSSADDITWYMPVVNSMIHSPVLGKEYTEDDEIITNCGKEGYIAIKRYGVDTNEELGAGITLINNEQMFRIKDYYNQTASNNTIYCEITKRGKKYKASISLLFGTAGGDGTEANFILKMYSCDKDYNPIDEVQALTIGEKTIIIPELYDYNNKPIDLKGIPISYSWKEKGNNGIQTSLKDNNYILNATSSSMANYHYYILQATIDSSVVFENPNKSQKTITTYLPIAVRINNNYSKFEGATKIVYDNSGSNPSYYKKPYQLFNENFVIYNDIKWQVANQKNDSLKYYPSIINNNELQPQIMYYDNLSPCCVYAIQEGNIVWTQPLLILKGQYASGVLSNWDGSLTIDEENGIILSTMIGAGIKNSDNSFSGVLLGNVTTSNAGVHSGIGLYGFDHNNQSYGFNVNGTAFIGKKGSGQIKFDGNKGTITSGNYRQNSQGMQIDLDDSIIRAYGPSGKFEMNMSNSSSNLLKISAGNKIIFNVGTGNYYLQTADYLYGSQGMKIDLEASSMNAYGKAGKFEMSMDSSSNNLLKIANNSNKILFNIGTNNYYLQTADYLSGSRGMKIDLEKSKLEAYGSAGSFIMNMDNTNNALLEIKTPEKKTIFSIGQKYYLQSANYVQGEKGIKLDLSAGNFEFMSTISNNTGIKIMSGEWGVRFSLYGEKGQVHMGGYAPDAHYKAVFTVNLNDGLDILAIGEGTCRIGKSSTDNGYFDLMKGVLVCKDLTIEDWKMNKEGLNYGNQFSVNSSGLLKCINIECNGLSVNGKNYSYKKIEFENGKLTPTSVNVVTSVTPIPVEYTYPVYSVSGDSTNGFVIEESIGYGVVQSEVSYSSTQITCIGSYNTEKISIEYLGL